MSTTYYQTLGVAQDACDDQIRQAYKALVLQHHPDKGGDEATFILVQQAYETLKDQHKRKTYDEMLRRGEPFAEAPFTRAQADSVYQQFLEEIAPRLLLHVR